jgi:hypothetical protein
MSWAYERVPGYELRVAQRKTLSAGNSADCAELCLAEKEFTCRSAAFNPTSGSCSLSHLDRHALPSNSLRGMFVPAAASNIDYIESNCFQGKCQPIAVPHSLT